MEAFAGTLATGVMSATWGVAFGAAREACANRSDSGEGAGAGEGEGASARAVDFSGSGGCGLGAVRFSADFIGLAPSYW